jgi:hypothetical protein
LVGPALSSSWGSFSNGHVTTLLKSRDNP